MVSDPAGLDHGYARCWSRGAPVLGYSGRTATVSV